MANVTIAVVEGKQDKKRRVLMQIGAEGGMAILSYSWTPDEAESLGNAMVNAAKEAKRTVVIAGEIPLQCNPLVKN
jgi:molybdopterin biosynthesis enzyme MoaB